MPPEPSIRIAVDTGGTLPNIALDHGDSLDSAQALAARRQRKP